jgi:hypothetical protein
MLVLAQLGSEALLVKYAGASQASQSNPVITISSQLLPPPRLRGSLRCMYMYI